MIFKAFSPAFTKVKNFHSSDIKITFSKYYFRNVKNCSVSSKKDKRLPLEESNLFVVLLGIKNQKF